MMWTRNQGSNQSQYKTNLAKINRAADTEKKALQSLHKDVDMEPGNSAESALNQSSKMQKNNRRHSRESSYLLRKDGELEPGISTKACKTNLAKLKKPGCRHFRISS